MSQILQKTSLCAIVRDEIMNPAGGIVDFVRCSVPFVERAVILDTGSSDGTYEALQRLKEEYPSLTLLQHPFEGYAESRNRALNEVKTEYVLVLDADERISEEDFQRMASIFNNNPCLFHLDGQQISPDGKKKDTLQNYPRFFRKKGAYYTSKCFGGAYENLNIFEQNMNRWIELEKKIVVRHFLPDKDGIDSKDNEWYGYHVEKNDSPTKCPSFKKWKTYNPQRELLNRQS